MSCNAHHGKLHESSSHVDALFLENGFHVEHVNVCYVLDLEHPPVTEQRGSAFSCRQNNGELEAVLITSLSGLKRYEARRVDTLIAMPALQTASWNLRTVTSKNQLIRTGSIWKRPAGSKRLLMTNETKAGTLQVIARCENLYFPTVGY